MAQAWHLQHYMSDAQGHAQAEKVLDVKSRLYARELVPNTCSGFPCIDDSSAERHVCIAAEGPTVSFEAIINKLLGRAYAPDL